MSRRHSLTLVTLLLLPPTMVLAQDTAPAHPSLDDPTIVAIFDIANTADIETGHLAMERGSSPKVRQMGKNFADAHAHVRELGRDLARKLGVTPTPPTDSAMVREHQAALQQLEALRGGAFDRAYLQREAEYHAAVIAAVTNVLLPAIRNAELRTLVETVAPAFESHLAAVRDLRKELGY